MGGGDGLQEQGVACQNVLESQGAATKPSRRGRLPCGFAGLDRGVSLFLSAFRGAWAVVQSPSEPMVFSLPLISKFPLHIIPRSQGQLLRLLFFFFF